MQDPRDRWRRHYLPHERVFHEWGKRSYQYTPCEVFSLPAGMPVKFIPAAFAFNRPVRNLFSYDDSP